MKATTLKVLSAALLAVSGQVAAANNGQVDVYYAIDTSSSSELKVGGATGGFKNEGDGFGIRGQYAFDIQPELALIIRADYLTGSGDSKISMGSGYEKLDKADQEKASVGVGLQYGANPRLTGALDYYKNDFDVKFGSDKFTAKEQGLKLSAKAAFDVIDNLELYAQLGYVIDGTAKNLFLPSTDVDGLAWGLGAAYKFAPTLAGFIEVAGADADGNGNVSGTSYKAETNHEEVKLGARWLF